MKKVWSTLIMILLVLALVACASSNNGSGNNTSGSAGGNTSTETKTPEPNAASEQNETEKPTTVEYTDANGNTATIPVNPKNVVSLDNRTFETLEAWGIKLAAAPKNVIPATISYKNDDSIQNIGSHTEPNLEVIAAVDPELVIVGQRFAQYYEDIKELVPNAAVINLDINVSAGDGTAGDNLVSGFKDITLLLGQIFDKNEEAEALVAEFDKAIADAKAAYNGTDAVISVIVSGGNIGYSAPHNGRVWGPLYDIFGWVSPLEIDNTSTDHQGDEISVEAIAQANPDWLMVLDRDAATSSAAESTPAKDVIENSPALKNTTAIKNGNIVYAPADTYTNESIQTYIEIFQSIAEALKK
jgi:iron complex transport system substrate-binding protein